MDRGKINGECKGGADRGGGGGCVLIGRSFVKDAPFLLKLITDIAAHINSYLTTLHGP